MKIITHAFRFGAATLAVLALSACGSGLVGDTPDGYFQVQGTPKGSVCVNGIYPDPNTGADKVMTEHLWRYYGGSLTQNTTTTYSDQGFGATCSNTFKPNADIVISKDFYEGTVVPATPL